MRELALRCIGNTHVEEGSNRPDGGWTINPKDRGNWTGGAVGKGELKGTKFGIAANTYPTLDIRNLTREQADAIYIRDYWSWAYGDWWPAGIDQVTYDATVNSGRGRGPLWTCRALGFADDRIGTVRAAATKANTLPTEGRVAVVKKACANRLSFLHAIKGPSGWATFGRGWGGRVQRMEAIGVRMVLEFAAKGAAAPAPAPANTNTAPAKPIAERLEKEAGQAQTKSNSAAASGTGTGGLAGGGATQIDPGQFDWTAWALVGGVALVAIVVIVACGWLWFKHRERAKAYLAAATGAIGG